MRSGQGLGFVIFAAIVLAIVFLTQSRASNSYASPDGMVSVKRGAYGVGISYKTEMSRDD